MAEPDFEAQLTRLYGEAPSFPDADLFASQISAALDRGWALRRLVIGAAGVAVGVIAAVQLVTTRFSAELQALSRDGARDVSSEVDTLLARLNHMVTTPASVEALWLAAGLAVLAIGFAVTRAMEEF